MLKAEDGRRSAEGEVRLKAESEPLRIAGRRDEAGIARRGVACEQFQVHGRLREMTVIADTGPLVALIDPDTREHDWARDQTKALPRPLAFSGNP